MKRLPIFGKNKRGHKYNRRQTKSADGFSATYASQKPITNPNHPKFDQEKAKKCLMLSLYGTMDKLNRKNHFQHYRREHPKDKGYFKQYIRLSSVGKARLLKLRKKYSLAGISPKWEVIDLNGRFRMIDKENRLLSSMSFPKAETWKKYKLRNDETALKAMRQFFILNYKPITQ